LPFVLAICVSCSGRGKGDIAPKPISKANSPTPPKLRATWYDPAATRHDFGLVLAGSDVTRSHTYRIANTSTHPVRILGVANRKPCCGDVKPIAPTTLGPGQAVEVAVELHIGLAAGRVLHLAEIQFEGDGDKILATELRTTGTGLARASIDPLEPARLSLELGESIPVEFLARSFGNRERPPFPIEESSIRSDAPIRWQRDAESRVDSDTGLDEIRRPLVVTLAASGEPGRRSTALALLDGGSAVARKVIDWEVAPAIRATPSGLIFAADSGAQKIILVSRKGHPFRVVPGRSTAEGLRLTPDDAEARSTHVVAARLDGEPTPDTRSGEIVVATDHPLQSLVKVAFYIPGRAPAGAKSETPTGASR